MKYKMKPPQEKLPLDNSIFRLISVSFEKAYLFVEIINLDGEVGATINIYLFCLEKLSTFYQKLVKSNKIICEHQIINLSFKSGDIQTRFVKEIVKSYA